MKQLTASILVMIKEKIIIPTSKYTYTERALNNTGIKYIKQKGQLYNKEALSKHL